ncbi:hypothetical protein GQ457_05G010980 [Hibiscus cannabinus]
MEVKSNKKYVGGMTIQECRIRLLISLQTPKVKFLMEQMEKAGCKVEHNFFNALNCERKMCGGYTRGRGITICSNHLTTQDDVDHVVRHELIHAYDDCLAANLNWKNCAHQACSEIRAGLLSGDCDMKQELMRHLRAGGLMKIRGQGQECLKRRVMLSVTANPFCSEKAAKAAMESVWDTCYNDTKPFDRAP